MDQRPPGSAPEPMPQPATRTVAPDDAPTEPVAGLPADPATGQGPDGPAAAGAAPRPPRRRAPLLALLAIAVVVAVPLIATYGTWGADRSPAPSPDGSRAPSGPPTASGRSPSPDASPSEPASATPTASPSPAPTPRSIDPIPLPPATPGALWISPEELAALPTSGPAWESLVATAEDGPRRRRDISCQDSTHNIDTMAVALVAARLDDDRLRRRVRDAIADVIDTERGSTCGHDSRNRWLALGRNLTGYVLAADLIGLWDVDPALDERFREWIDPLRTWSRRDEPSLSLADLDSAMPDNWGAHAGASRVAASLYLGDMDDVGRSAASFAEFATDGDGYEYRDSWDLSWACDPEHPTPINGPCTRDGNELDGIVVADMRRGDGYRWPPRQTRYPRETIVGRTVQAQLLERAGFPAFDQGDEALRRAGARLLALDAVDGDWYEPEINAYWLLDARFGGFPTEGPAVGRQVAGVDWTHP